MYTHLFFNWNCKKIIHVTGRCHEHPTIKFVHVQAARKRYCLLLLLVQYAAIHIYQHDLSAAVTINAKFYYNF